MLAFRVLETFYLGSFLDCDEWMDNNLHVRLPSGWLLGKQNGGEDGVVDVVAFHAEDNGASWDRHLHTKEEVQSSIAVAHLPSYHDVGVCLDSMQVLPG